MNAAYDTKFTKEPKNTGHGKYANMSGKRHQYKRHSKPKTLTEEEVRRCERMEAEDAYRKHLLSRKEFERKNHRGVSMERI